MEDRLFRNAMGSFATGVTVIATETNGGAHGMTANAFMSQSLEPKLIIISLKEDAHMLTKIKESGQFSVNVLSDDQQNLSMIFAGQAKSESEFEFDYLDGKPVIPGALAQVACSVKSEYVEGDHSIFIGQVTDFHLEDGEPLIFSKGQYRSLEKSVTANL
ncbi:flavin reductase family protein [Aquibacillus saliphilus]|uniref:flavin reductase family protein n=1 Tax=Aquibacillus saliphilus TaxID=1909422 RepID=UPI001CF050DE|nr:flavin reductase family protein [Aquibacillus saliphilus]